MSDHDLENSQTGSFAYRPTRASVRSLMSQLLRTDADLEAFCIDHYKQAALQFSGAMSRKEKENLLLKLIDTRDLVQSLRENNQDAFERYVDLIVVEEPGASLELDSEPAASYSNEQARELGKLLKGLYQKRAQLEIGSGDIEKIDQLIDELRNQQRVGLRPNPGELFANGRFELLHELSRSDFLEYWRAYDRINRQDVGFKVLNPQWHNDSSKTAVFIQTARIQSKIHSPYIAELIKNVGLEYGFYYCVQQYMAGVSLRTLVSSQAIPFNDLIKYCQQVGRVLQTMHQLGVVYRALSPDKITITANQNVHIADFDSIWIGGFSRSIEWTDRFPFTAPEVLFDTHNISPRADIYSLGMILVYLLNGGELPESAFRDTQTFVKGLPCNEYTRIAILKAVSWNPAERYADMSSFCNDMGQFLPTEHRMPGSRPSKDNEVLSAARAVRPWWGVLGSFLLAMSVLGLIVFCAISYSKGRLFDSSPDVPKKSGYAVVSPIRIGVINSISGTMAISARPVIDATLMAIQEINDTGGLLGRKVLPIVVDGRSINEVFESESERLISQENVVALFGGWTPSNRKALRPIVEKHDHMLFFPARDEGMEDSDNIIYNGPTPNQQLLPAVQWAIDKLHSKRIFFVGSDGLLGRVSYELLKDGVAGGGASVVGSSFALLSEIDFSLTIQQLQAARPDVIINTISGDSNLSFFRALRDAKISSHKIPTISLGIGENELKEIVESDMVGDYLAWTSFEVNNADERKRFSVKFKRKYGEYRAINDSMEAAYWGVHLWAWAVRAVGSENVQVVRRFLINSTANNSSPEIKIDPKNNHSWKRFRIGRILDDNRLEICHTIEDPIPPNPFPGNRTRYDWETFLNSLLQRWNHNWVNPQRPPGILATSSRDG